MNRTFIKGFLAGNALLIAGLAATAIGIKTKVINPSRKKKNKLKWVENEQPENGLCLKLTNIIRKT